MEEEKSNLFDNTILSDLFLCNHTQDDSVPEFYNSNTLMNSEYFLNSTHTEPPINLSLSQPNYLFDPYKQGEFHELSQVIQPALLMSNQPDESLFEFKPSMLYTNEAITSSTYERPSEQLQPLILINPDLNTINKKATPSSLKKKKKKRRVILDIPNKPKRITGLHKPLILSTSLQAIMDGETQLSRPEIVKKLWNYIKLNELQDPSDRRFILCDEKLKLIFQKDRVNSFGMNRDLSSHLTTII